jgi:hypothetical protein
VGCKKINSKLLDLYILCTLVFQGPNWQDIKKILRDDPRNYAMFVVGINTNLRAADLLSLKAGRTKLTN